MKSRLFSCSFTKSLLMITVLMSFSWSAAAAALFTLRGNTPEAKLESESELRLSVLGWTEDEQARALAEEYQRYAESQDHEAFQSFLQSQETKGYLFTKEATGHTIKYAWEDRVGDVKRMVMLVTPALKTRNPYMWKEPNTSAVPFSLLELRFKGEEAVMKTSLNDAAVSLNADGRPELQDYEAANEFATLRDDTPYYLKRSS